MPEIPQNLPPADGSVSVLPGFLDFHAEHNPNRPWVIFPSDSQASGTSSISFGEFAKATHRVAHHVRPGRQGSELQVVGIVAHTDAVLYMAVIVGLMRAGIVPLLVSPKLSAEAIARLFKQTSAHRVITQDPFLFVLKDVQTQLGAEGFNLAIEDFIPIEQAFPALKIGDVATQLVEGTYPKAEREPSADDTIMYIHSSGSTGFPKSVKLTGRILLQWSTSSIIWDGRKRGVQWGSMVYLTFHITGLYMQLLAPLVSGQPVGLYAPRSPAAPPVPTADSAIEVCRITKCNAIAAVPTFIEHWAQSDEHIQFLASLESLSFAGGPVSSKSGAKLVQVGVPLYSIYGVSECGAHSKNFDVDDSQGLNGPGKTSADWEWFQFSDSVNPRFIAQGDGKYELHYLTCETHQPSVENLSDVKGYATSDLFVPHPTKTGLWRIVGRIDDVIVLSTGENIVPIPQEAHLVSNTMIAGAVMFGRSRDFPGVLIEPRAANAVDNADKAAVSVFINTIWPIIEEANKHSGTHARITRDMVILTDAARPLPRAAKGTVIRKQALALYDDDIEILYASIANSKTQGGQATSTLHTSMYR
ncbi:hypothetical protein BC629DRAFT_1496418 [Irpex lacteus]|nr:hypothetical protein BC629DRAFT_1496418 [Irpex lacteus]